MTTVNKYSPRLKSRLAYGRLRSADWLDGESILVGTAAQIWRWNLADGFVVPFTPTGCQQLSVNRPAGIAAAHVECPERGLVVISLADGRIVQRLPGHGGALIKSLALSPDGALIASGGSDRMLRIRRVATGEEVMLLEHPGGFSSFDGNPDVIAFSPDGKTLASAATDGTYPHLFWLWDLATGNQILEGQLPLSAKALAFSPDGQTLVAGLDFGGGSTKREDRFVAVVDLPEGTVRLTPDTPTVDNERGDDVRSVAFSPDGKLCVVGDDHGYFAEDSALHIFDTQTWQRVAHRVLAGKDHQAHHFLCPSHLSFSDDGQKLLAVIATETNQGTGGVEFALQVWNTTTWQKQAVLDRFISTVNDLSLLLDDNLLAATDEGLRRYQDEAYSIVVPGNFHRVAAAPDGKTAVVSYDSFDGKACLVDLESGKVGEELPGITKGMINSLAFASDSQHYALCHDDYWVRKMGRKSAVKRADPNQVSARERVSAAASSDGKLAFVSWQGTVVVWWGKKYAESSGLLISPGPSRRLNAAAFSPDGQQLAAAGGFLNQKDAESDRRGRVFIWQWPDMTVREMVTPEVDRWFDSIAWSPDGRLIAAGTMKGLVCFFDADSSAFIGEVLAHGSLVTALVFSADSRRLYSASNDGSIAVLTW